MASESVQGGVLSIGQAREICDMLLDAIKAKHELDLVRGNIEAAAREKMTAKSLVELDMLPKAVDLDVCDAAEMVQIMMQIANPEV